MYAASPGRLGFATARVLPCVPVLVSVQPWAVRRLGDNVAVGKHGDRGEERIGGHHDAILIPVTGRGPVIGRDCCQTAPRRLLDPGQELSNEHSWELHKPRSSSSIRFDRPRSAFRPGFGPHPQDLTISH